MNGQPTPETPDQPKPELVPELAPDFPPAAHRALAEAEERRRKAADPKPLPPELGGRDGPDPVRYGDWEKKGIAIDF